MLAYYADTVISDYYAGRPIPGGYSPESDLWNNITFAYSYLVVAELNSNQTQNQIYGVPLIEGLIGYLQSTQNGSSSIQYLLLSAHDSTIVLLMSVLDVLNLECMWVNFDTFGIQNDSYCHYPGFASNVKIELWSQDNGDYIRFLYDDVPLIILGCTEEFCPYDTFMMGL